MKLNKYKYHYPFHNGRGNDLSINPKLDRFKIKDIYCINYVYTPLVEYNGIIRNHIFKTVT